MDSGSRSDDNNLDWLRSERGTVAGRATGAAGTTETRGAFQNYTNFGNDAAFF